MSNNDKILSVTGPTCVGKSELAFLLARKLNGEILSSDSRQIYTYMDIGTDKPGKKKLREIKHHFIDIKQPDEYYSAGQYAKDALKVIDRIFHLGKIPIVVGGSGLYIKALFDGIFDEPVKDLSLKKKLRQRAKEEGSSKLYEELCNVDPDYASLITPNDSQRIVRALEVFYVTGRKISRFWEEQETENILPVIFIGLMRKREELYERIEKRIDKMLETGLLDETRRILDMGFDKNLNLLNTIGYKEVIAFLEGTMTYEEMSRLIKQKTRNYAKRQITWFKKDIRIDWYYKNQNNSLEDITKVIINKYFRKD